MARRDNAPLYMSVQDICHTRTRINFYCKDGVEVKLKKHNNTIYGVVVQNKKVIYKTEEHKGFVFLATAYIIYDLELYLKTNFRNPTMGGL